MNMHKHKDEAVFVLFRGMFPRYSFEYQYAYEPIEKALSTIG